MFFIKIILLFNITLQFVNSHDCNSDLHKSKFFWVDKKVREASYFSNFARFNDILLECNKTYNTSKYVEFLPKNKLIIDKSFQMMKLVDVFHYKKIRYIVMTNTKGFDLNYNQVFGQSGKEPIQFPKIFLTMSIFNTYVNGKKKS